MAPARRHVNLSALLADVHAARMAVRQARGFSSKNLTVRAAQQDLVRSLRAFTDELAARGLPVPHVMDAEARMYRDVLAVSQR